MSVPSLVMRCSFISLCAFCLVIYFVQDSGWVSFFSNLHLSVKHVGQCVLKVTFLKRPHVLIKIRASATQNFSKMTKWALSGALVPPLSCPRYLTPTHIPRQHDSYIALYLLSLLSCMSSFSFLDTDIPLLLTWGARSPGWCWRGCSQVLFQDQWRLCFAWRQMLRNLIPDLSHLSYHWQCRAAV